ncbi:unnamed protein product [Effrenium voratum]|uniref:Uncharacterized protein n=1 Tax=Effrenium voratum TaxID=2562239 RepID=A0AA36J939_9DINO|nr:unnamed protein product [Effrenium voratum]CAJ1426994.1 unnamed protein product [Effrenium voratum]
MGCKGSKRPAGPRPEGAGQVGQGTSQSTVATEADKAAVDGKFAANAKPALTAAAPIRSARGVSEVKTYSAEQQAAAGKIGAAVRGSATRWEVKQEYHEIRRRPEGRPLQPIELGFADYAQKKPSMPSVPDHLRFRVRDVTKQRVLAQLGNDEGLGSFSTFEMMAARLLEKVAASGKLPPGPAKQMASTHLFNGEEVKADAEDSLAKRQDTYLLGKFQIVAVPVVADYDAAFDVLQVESNSKQTAKPDAPSRDCDGPEGFNGWFWVLHSAAPNIGESALAEDFLSYSVEEVQDNDRPLRIDSVQSQASTSSTSRCCWKDRPMRTCRRLNEDLYIADIARLWRNALLAMKILEVEDAILFPFGMGAFLRHLNLNDDRYEDPARLHMLKRRIAAELMNAIVDICTPPGSGKSKAVSKAGPQRVHLCLVCVNPESIDNHNCFVEAAADKAQQCPQLKKILQLRQNVDSLQLAHELSHRGQLKVALLNGANRKLCGNHWFQSGARFAIDENLHRRSASLSRASLLVNFDTEPRPRRSSQLEETIRFFGGRVVNLAQTGAKEKATNAKPEPLGNEKVEPKGGKDTAAPVAKAKAKKPFCLCCGGSKSAQKPAAKKAGKDSGAAR